VDFVEICNVYIRKMIIIAAKKIFNSGKICRSYSDLNFGVTFFGTQCIYRVAKNSHNCIMGGNFVAKFSGIKPERFSNISKNQEWNISVISETVEFLDPITDEHCQ